MKTHKIYIGGTFSNTKTTLEVTNKYNGKIFSTTWLAGSKELELAIKKAEQAKEEMKNLPSYKKYSILNKIAKQLKNNHAEFSKVIVHETGKPLKYAKSEVDRAIQTLRIAAEESKRIPTEYFSLDWTPAGEGKEAFVKCFPVGIVAGISPFNFPLNLATHKIGPAIAAGCPIILKPARLTCISSLMLAEIIDKTELPKGAFSVLPMNREVGNLLVTDSRFAKISFTGSPEVGWKIKKECGKKRVTLELGGNAGCIVTETADLETTVKKCITGAFAYSGQICIHLQRIYVHKSIFLKFTNKFLEQTCKLKKGNPLNPDTDISVMINKENATRVKKWIDEAVNQGAKVLLGGKQQKNYIEPTIISNSTNKMKISSLEVFGPVVTIEPYENYHEAINEINSSNYGLQAGIFTDSNQEINYAFNKLEMGGIIINDIPTFRVDHMPYGGTKDSGFGREGVKYAIAEMLEPKLMVKNK